MLAKAYDECEQPHVAGLKQEKRRKSKCQWNNGNAFRLRVGVRMLLLLHLVLREERQHQRGYGTEQDERDEQNINAKDRYQSRQVKIAETPEAELHDEKHTKGSIRIDGPCNNSETNAHQGTTDYPVHESNADQRRHIGYQHRQQVGNYQRHNQRVGSGSPAQSLDKEYDRERARRRTVHVGRTHIASLL